jgi:hypothetical protein
MLVLKTVIPIMFFYISKSLTIYLSGFFVNNIFLKQLIKALRSCKLWKMKKLIFKALIFFSLIILLSSCYSTKKIVITKKMQHWEKKKMSNTRKKDLTKPKKRRKKRLDFDTFLEKIEKIKKSRDQMNKNKK